jgi:ActR/RegA family two-component response regulator
MSFATRGAGALIADACMGIGTAPLAMRILLIEDDAMIGRGLLRGLGDQGIAVDWVRTGPDGGAARKQGDHSLVLLDLGLPGKSGFDLDAANDTIGGATLKAATTGWTLDF